MTSALINRFADWFGSVACVVETSVVCLALVILEAARPGIDPHGFRYLYALTVYSAVTQPALAYAAERLARFLRETISLLLDIAEAESARNRSMQAQTAALLELLAEAKERAARDLAA